MQSSFNFLFVFGILLFSSCSKKGDLIYIKMPNNATIAEKYKVRVLFRGTQIGEVREKVNRQNEYLLLTAIIDRRNHKNKFTGAIYREDLLGNTYVELISKQPEMLRNNNDPPIDTLYGVYSPLYHEVDSASKEKILNEIGNFKKRLDSILENR